MWPVRHLHARHSQSSEWIHLSSEAVVGCGSNPQLSGGNLMRVIVCGAGQVGSTIARHLAAEGMHVTVIDLSKDQARQIDESYDVRGITGHASHPAVLEEAGAAEADMLIAVTRSDEVNMVACQVAYSLFNVKRRIARLRHVGYLAPGRRGLYAAEHLPIDVIISPEIEIADGIARRLRTPGAFDMVSMAEGRVQLLGIHCNSAECSFVGDRYSDLAKKTPGAGMTIVAVVRNGRAFIPDNDDEFEVGDDAYVVALTVQVGSVMAAFGHTEEIARRIIIVGGGNIGIHLIRKLQKEAPEVSLKIIEREKVRAEEIAREVGSAAVVLQGDALDRAMLEEANVGAAETIVAVTNDDETNIFASVLAKRAGCPRAITLVSKRSYEPLMPMLGIDSVVSPSEVTISTVLRHVRHSNISALYTLREDFGEVIEAEIEAGSTLVDRPLSGLGLPSGMIIGAVIRAGEPFIPDGDTELKVGDHIVALVTYGSLKKAESLLVCDRKKKGMRL